MGVYSAIRLTEESANALRNWALSMGFNGVIQTRDMHITTCYSKDVFMPPETKKYITKAKVKQVLRSGTDKRTIVLVLECQEALDRNAELRSLGATSDYKGYTPHISVSYSDESVDVNQITNFPDDLVLDHDYFEPLNVNWTA